MICYYYNRNSNNFWKMASSIRLLNSVIHLTSTGFLTGAVILNYFFNTNEFLEDDPNYLQFAVPICSVLAGVSGIVSTFYLKPAK